MNNQFGNIANKLPEKLDFNLNDEGVIQYKNSQLDLSPSFNKRHSNSEGLPDRDNDSQKPLIKIGAKEKDHYNFLHALRQRLNVDGGKLV